MIYGKYQKYINNKILNYSKSFPYFCNEILQPQFINLEEKKYIRRQVLFAYFSGIFMFYMYKKIKICQPCFFQIHLV